MDLAWFPVVAIAIDYGADALLEWLERRRGARFENRQMVFFAIILPLALAVFWLMRALGKDPMS